MTLPSQSPIRPVNLSWSSSRSSSLFFCHWDHSACVHGPCSCRCGALPLLSCTPPSQIVSARAIAGSPPHCRFRARGIARDPYRVSAGLTWSPEVMVVSLNQTAAPLIHIPCAMLQRHDGNAPLINKSFPFTEPFLYWNHPF